MPEETCPFVRSYGVPSSDIDGYALYGQAPPSE